MAFASVKYRFFSYLQIENGCLEMTLRPQTVVSIKCIILSKVRTMTVTFGAAVCRKLV